MLMVMTTLLVIRWVRTVVVKSLTLLCVTLCLSTWPVHAQTPQGLPMSPFDGQTCQPLGVVDTAKSLERIVGKSSIPSAGIHFGRAGFAYLNGCGTIAKDWEEAKYWLELGAVSKDASSIHNLAWMHHNGLGVPVDPLRAKQLYQSLIDSSEYSPSTKRAARSNLALLDAPAGASVPVAAAAPAAQASAAPASNPPPSGPAWVGSPVVPDFDEARQCANARATIEVARAFARSAIASPGLAKSRCNAVTGSTSGARTQHISCKSMVDYFAIAGHLQMACAPAVKVDYEEARYWFELGDSGDDAVSTHNLAWLHHNGLGVPKDEAKAASLYRKIVDGAAFSPAEKRASQANLALIPPPFQSATVASPARPIPAGPASATMQPSAKPPAVTVATPDQSAKTRSGRRLALVIGNNRYRNVPALANAVEDATSIANSLRTVGYQVTLRTDITQKDMQAALRTFSGQLQGGDEVLFYFAGHGVQLGAANYLLPVDIAGESEAQVRDDAVQLQRVLDDIAEQKVRFTLAMVDACRDNPFKSSGRAIGGRGLAPTTAATGQMIIFSAGSGQQALDKLGPSDNSRNGLFTRVFLKEMQKPGVSVDRLVRNVRAEVVELARSVGHEQVPAIYDQAIGDFYFR